jgi:hypothetical protein
LNDYLPVILIIIGGIFLGGVYSVWSNRQVGRRPPYALAGLLLLIAAVALAGGALRLAAR